MIMYLFHDEGDFSVTIYTVFIKLHSAPMQNTVDFIIWGDDTLGYTKV